MQLNEDNTGIHFIGKFTDLIVFLSKIENKKITVYEYILDTAKKASSKMN